MTHIRKTGFLGTLLAAALLTACGGGDNDAFQPGTGPDTPPPVVSQVSSLTITTSSPTLPSDGSEPAEIRVYARNANNQFMADVPISFVASSGGLNITQAVTDENGLARATLIPLTPEQRTITVTASAGTVSASVNVVVGGTRLGFVQGPVALSLQQKGTYTVQLQDAGNRGIAGEALTVTSARNNTITPANVTTDANGRATFELQVVNGGDDTLTVTGAGLTATQAVAVNSDAFVFTTQPGLEVPLNTPETVTVNWTVAGVPQVGQQITFSTTRGSVTPVTVTTDASGNATATIQANNAGGAVVTATTVSGSSASLPVEFVATTPASIDVQPSVFTLGTGQSSTITAVVRDTDGNLVKGQTVTFTLVEDVTGGTLSAGTAVTDSQGRASTVYTASSTTSGNEGVKIRAAVGDGSINDTVALTVARREVFISLGTGNTISEPNEAQYALQFAVTVTDANGAGVANVPVSMRILSTRYYKGARALAAPPAVGWTTTYSVPEGCPDEDVNRNGQLDFGEDLNDSGRLEAGNIASVSPASATTDSAGVALVTVTYPQEFAYYLDVELSASATVQGTEYVRSSKFMLAGSAADFNSTTTAPPGPVSPFGTANTCVAPD